jgi:hypothetical protein
MVKQQKNGRTVLWSYLYTRKVVNRRWKIIVYLMFFVKYSAVVNEKLEAQSKQFLCFARMESEKADVVLVHSLQ